MSKRVLLAGAVGLLVVGLIIVALVVSSSKRSATPPTTSVTTSTRSSTGTSRVTGTAFYNWGVPAAEFGGIKAGLQHDTPTLVSGIPDPITQISTSNTDTYVLTSTGAVWAWGAGSLGELGDGAKTPFVSNPTQVRFPAGVKIVSIPNPTPYNGGLAIDSQGNIWGWGFNPSHDLCLPTRLPVLVPTKLPLSDVTLASGAGEHSIFYSHGKVYACGLNQDGELGDGTTTDSSTAKVVVGLPNLPVRALVSSWQGSGALMANGAYYDWGYNKAGELGDGKRTNGPKPVRVSLPAAVRQVSQGGSYAGNGQTVVLLSNGSVWSWGTGTWGQLGNGTRKSVTSPVRVKIPGGVTFTQVNSGGSTSYALDSHGALWAWGENNLGQVGVGGKTGPAVPAAVGVVLTEVSSTADNVAGFIRSA
jgi:alpha-tubulin suppressor-like RCC1 family protein